MPDVQDQTDQAPQYGEHAGRVIITWPKASDPKAVLSNLVTIEDADSGEQMTGALGLRLTIGNEDGFTPGILTVELDEVIAENGEPGRGASWMPASTPESLKQSQRVKAFLAGRSVLDLTDAEVDELDAMQTAFTGPHFRTCTRMYLVAEMRIAD